MAQEIIELKTQNPWFTDTWDGYKNAEVRKRVSGEQVFNVGDPIRLVEIDKDRKLTGRTIEAYVSYVCDITGILYEGMDLEREQFLNQRVFYIELKRIMRRKR